MAPDLTEMQLITFGWVPWGDAIRLAPAATGLWLGPTAYHCGELPEAPPVTHRVHAWDANGNCWRMICDRDQVLVTQLLSRDHVTDAATPNIVVHVRRTAIQPWQAVETGPVPQGLPSLQRLEVTTNAPASGIASTISFLQPLIEFG